jgi:predicted RNA-binding protein with PIN domain
MNNNTTLILGFGGALLTVFLLSRGCNQPAPPQPPMHRDSIITKIDTLQVHDKILVERWHKAIVKTDSITKMVYFSAPDTCDTYINEVVVAYQNERDSVTAVVNSKDSILTQYKTLSKNDSISIANLQNDTTKLRKQVKRRGRIAFTAGYILGLGTIILTK